MRRSDLSRYGFSIGMAAAIVSGCSGPQPEIGAPSLVQSTPRNQSVEWPSRGLLSQEAERTASRLPPQYKPSPPLLFVVNFITNSTNGDVVIYDAKADNPSPIAVITKGLLEPNGDCIDGDGTLYVTNRGSSGVGWISEYPIGQTKPSKQVTTGVDGPAFCTIDAQGNLWVANAFGPNVTQYLKGSTKPHTIIKNGLTHPDGIAIDHAGNLYVGDLQPYGTSNVQVYPPGSKSPSRTITDGVKWPVGIAVDTNDTLYVTNDNAPCNIQEYLAGQNHPYKAITNEINGPTGVTVGKNGRLYESNEGTQGCSGPWPVILEFRPGSLKPSSRMIRIGLQNPVGNAYYPPLLP